MCLQLGGACDMPRSLYRTLQDWNRSCCPASWAQLCICCRLALRKQGSKLIAAFDGWACNALCTAICGGCRHQTSSLASAGAPIYMLWRRTRSIVRVHVATLALGRSSSSLASWVVPCHMGKYRRTAPIVGRGCGLLASRGQGQAQGVRW